MVFNHICGFQNMSDPCVCVFGFQFVFFLACYYLQPQTLFEDTKQAASTTQHHHHFFTFCILASQYCNAWPLQARLSSHAPCNAWPWQAKLSSHAPFTSQPQWQMQP